MEQAASPFDGPAPRPEQEQRDDEQVRRGEWGQERRDEPSQRTLVARVVDEVFRQPRKSLVVEPELLAEPAGGAGIAPPLERDRVDVDEAEGRDGAAGADDEHRKPPQL